MRFLFTIIAISLVQIINAQSFEAILNSERYEIVNSVTETSNNKYIVSILGSYPRGTDWTSRVVLLNTNGEIVKDQPFSNLDNYSHIITGTYLLHDTIVVTSAVSCNSGQDDRDCVYISRLDMDLNIIDDAFHPLGFGVVNIAKLRKLSDKCAVIVGYERSNQSLDLKRSFVMELNHGYFSGNIGHSPTFTTNASLFFMDAAFAPNIEKLASVSNLWILGIHAIMEFDNNFNLIEFYHLPINFGFSAGGATLLKKDNNYFFNGSIEDGQPLNNVGVVKFNENFDVLATSSIPFSYNVQWIPQLSFGMDTTTNGLYYLAWRPDINNLHFGEIDDYFHLTKVDNDLNVTWRKTFGGNGYYWITGIVSTTDGGCIIYGYKRKENTPDQTQPYILKLDSDGIFTAIDENITNNETNIHIYPNPATEEITVSLPSEENYKATIINAAGKSVKQIRHLKTNDKINISQLPKGIYLLQITEKGVLLGSKTFVKQ